jgi:neutral ceramidase
VSRPRLLALLVALAAALAAAPSAAAAPKLQAGVGRADITPPTGYYMMGWVRSDAKIQGANTRLWARVIVLKQGGRKIALVSEDLNGIPGGMLKQAADMNRDIGFSQANVLDSASHTHAAPAGFYNFSTYNTVFMTITTPTDFDVAGDRDQQLYAFMVRRLALAIRRANADLGPASAGWGEVNIDNLTQNRSIEAHLYDHGIHLGYGKGKPSMDPDGRLHTIDRQGNVLRVDRVRGRRRFPIGIWSTFANHGTVNRFQFNFYNEDHHGAATKGVERALRRRGRVPRGQDVVAAYGNSDEGDMSSGLTRMGPAAADYVGSVEARAFLRAWRAAGAHMQRRPRLSWRWTRMCFCGQMTSAGQVADKQGSFGLAEFTGSEEGRGPLFDITHTPFEGDHLPAGNGPQGDKEQTLVPAKVPVGVPLMSVRIGNRVIVSVPGEMTADMGRRVRAAVLKAASGSGVVRTIISGLANEYTSYFTTPQEYDAQHYEGAATVYGRASSVAIEDALVALTKTLVGGKAAPKPYPYDPTQGVSPAGQPFSKGASRGHDLTQPATPVGRLGHTEFAWYGGQRGFDRPLDRAFVRIQRRSGRRWRTVDSDLGLRTVWKVNDSGRYTVRWEVPIGARVGRYRFVVTANRYRLVSRFFKVRTSRALAAVRVGARAGHAAFRLTYPAPSVNEDVNTPAGDFDADLMARPRFASRGRATVVVNGHTRHVRARHGVFTFRAAAGAKVRVPVREARDRYGNANGRLLAFTR